MFLVDSEGVGGGGGGGGVDGGAVGLVGVLLLVAGNTERSKPVWGLILNIHGRRVWLGGRKNVAGAGGAVFDMDHPTVIPSIFPKNTLIQPFTVELQSHFGHKAINF